VDAPPANVTWRRCACRGVPGVRLAAVSGAFQGVRLVFDVHVLAGHFTTQSAAVGVKAARLPCASCTRGYMGLNETKAGIPQMLQGVDGCPAQGTGGKESEALGLKRDTHPVGNTFTMTYSLQHPPAPCSCSSEMPEQGCKKQSATLAETHADATSTSYPGRNLKRLLSSLSLTSSGNPVINTVRTSSAGRYGFWWYGPGAGGA
jgi:hypothetical protein